MTVRVLMFVMCKVLTVLAANNTESLSTHTLNLNCASSSYMARLSTHDVTIELY